MVGIYIFRGTWEAVQSMILFDRGVIAISTIINNLNNKISRHS